MIGDEVLFVMVYQSKYLRSVNVFTCHERLSEDELARRVEFGEIPSMFDNMSVMTTKEFVQRIEAGGEWHVDFNGPGLSLSEFVKNMCEGEYDE